MFWTCIQIFSSYRLEWTIVLETEYNKTYWSLPFNNQCFPKKIPHGYFELYGRRVEVFKCEMSIIVIWPIFFAFTCRAFPYKLLNLKNWTKLGYSKLWFSLPSMLCINRFFLHRRSELSRTEKNMVKKSDRASKNWLILTFVVQFLEAFVLIIFQNQVYAINLFFYQNV